MSQRNGIAQVSVDPVEKCFSYIRRMVHSTLRAFGWKLVYYDVCSVFTYNFQIKYFSLDGARFVSVESM